ncbi:biotin-dependent carboxyltransferase family protein [Methyloferula stellata]|uniref:5-oxoprolinase subunit C family protein n=1 Tax=Methyloferula stellata TaxID=876270 RepID=UPI0003699460|nr:biotin-dependent carboxyltransferase family protein [Methyloferula stellata]
MAAHLKVVRAGPGTTIQDSGRFHWRRFGVTPSGPMDWAAFRTVNRVLGNAHDAGTIEISVGGFEAGTQVPLDLAFGGGGFLWTRDGRALPSPIRITLRPGERLAAKPGAWGAWAYLAVKGGFDTAIEMGSRSTHLRSGIGGRMIEAGDSLPALSQPDAAMRRDARIEAPWLDRDMRPIRILLGPQDDYFTADALALLFSEAFSLTASADRMAYRLKGPKIEHASGFNIVSDGIALGAVQIGGDGQPLVLMADHQPTGGYPKIGSVIKADIGRLAQMRPGETCRFVLCGMAEARAALFALEDKIAAVTSKATAAGFSSEILRSLNLIDGVVDTRRDASDDQW